LSQPSGPFSIAPDRHRLNHSPVLRGGRFPYVDTLVLLAVAGACSAAALREFLRRDL
jgi:hypothetical protein